MGVPIGGGARWVTSPPGIMLFSQQLVKFPIRNKFLKIGLPMYSD